MSLRLDAVHRTLSGGAMALFARWIAKGVALPMPLRGDPISLHVDPFHCLARIVSVANAVESDLGFFRRGFGDSELVVVLDDDDAVIPQFGNSSRCVRSGGAGRIVNWGAGTEACSV